MTRRCLAFLAATAMAAVAAPAIAQDGPPTPPPEWTAPQTPDSSGPDAAPQSRDRHAPGEDSPNNAGAPFAHHGPPGAYRGGAAPFSPESGSRGPTAWGAPGSAYGYGYRYGAAPTPCGCAGYAYPPVMWVRVPIETRYRYSAPIRHEKDVVHENVVGENVAETKTVPVRTTRHTRSSAKKYTKSTKSTKGKAVHTSR